MEGETGVVDDQWLADLCKRKKKQATVSVRPVAAELNLYQA